MLKATELVSFVKHLGLQLPRDVAKTMTNNMKLLIAHFSGQEFELDPSSGLPPASCQWCECR